jgi:hypothetical protein
MKKLPRLPMVLTVLFICILALSRFSHFVELTYLRFNNEIVYGKVTKISYEYERRAPYYAVEYSYEYNDKQLNGGSASSIGPIRAMIWTDDPYNINDEIKLLINTRCVFPADELNYQIFIRLVALLLVLSPLMILGIGALYDRRTDNLIRQK